MITSVYKYSKMSFYPMFIPMSGGGGGGPREALATLAIVGSLAAGIVAVAVVPRFRTGAEQNRPHYPVQIQHKGDWQADISGSVVKGHDCLLKKGYTVDLSPSQPWLSSGGYDSDMGGERIDYVGYSTWKTIASISKEGGRQTTTVEQVLEDCKQCQVHTFIKYRYDAPIFGTVKSQKELYWHKAELR